MAAFALISPTAFAQDDIKQPKELEEYEPEYRDIPELLMQYNLKLDKNNALPITTEFVMQQIIDPEKAAYRTDSIMKGTQREDSMPAWLIYLTMEGCQWC